jgi:hypothetical protein
MYMLDDCRAKKDRKKRAVRDDELLALRAIIMVTCQSTKK